jgi:anti-anti-sigma regulatory factor
MLKISRGDNPDRTGRPVLKLEGQVRGRWVEELRRTCAELLAADGSHVTLDLSDVSFIDTPGLTLFKALSVRNVTFTNCSLFAAEQLKGVANER